MNQIVTRLTFWHEVFISNSSWSIQVKLDMASPAVYSVLAPIDLYEVIDVGMAPPTILRAQGWRWDRIWVGHLLTNSGFKRDPCHGQKKPQPQWASTDKYDPEKTPPAGGKPGDKGNSRLFGKS
jgi:hypothetical protein